MSSKTPETEANTTDNGEVATVPNGAIDASRPTGRFIEFLTREAERQAGTRSLEVMSQQLDRILTAETDQEIMEADMFGTHQGRDLEGLEIEIPEQEVRVAKSSGEYEAPLGHYVQFHATALMDYPSERIKVGDDLIISTGAPLVVGKLMTYRNSGRLPIRVMFVGVKAPEGTVLKFGPIPNRAVQPDTA